MTFEEINFCDLLPEKARAMVTARGRPSGTATTNTVTPMIINFISGHVTVKNCHLTELPEPTRNFPNRFESAKEKIRAVLRENMTLTLIMNLK